MKYQKENFNGERDFRCNFHDGWVMSANLHEYSEFLYCKSGEGEVIVNGKSLRISAKQLVWIPPNYIHRFNCKRAQVICAVFSNDLIPLFFRTAEGKRLIVSPVDVSAFADILDKFHELKKENYLTVSGYLNLIAARVVECSELEGGERTDGVLYQKVISYVSEHYTESITLEGLSGIFGYNKKYLSHALHGLTGIHFRQLLAFYRIKYAKDLLIREKDMNITDIALSSGFFAANTFHRAFKEATGMVPSEYRRLYHSTP